MGFGSLGISELLVIFVVVLVFFGPKRMPEVARSLGSAMREFRRSLNQIQRELEEADPTSELRKETKSILSQLPEQVRPTMADNKSPQRTTESRGAAEREQVSEPEAEREQVSEPEAEQEKVSESEAEQSSEPTNAPRSSETGSESG